MKIMKITPGSNVLVPTLIGGAAPPTARVTGGLPTQFLTNVERKTLESSSKYVISVLGNVAASQLFNANQER